MPCCTRQTRFGRHESDDDRGKHATAIAHRVREADATRDEIDDAPEAIADREWEAFVDRFFIILST